MTHAAFIAAAPWVFVFLWSTGWIAARAAAPHADALTFLSWRFALAGIALGVIALVRRSAWPTTTRLIVHCLVAGALIHGCYLGGVWWAVGQGVPAGVSGVIAATQPILTAALGPALLGERLLRVQWIGVAVGFAGILLVLAPKLAGVETGRLAAIVWPLAINFGGMIAVTVGTIYQKRFVPSGDLTTLTTLQYAGAVAVVLPLALLFEPLRFDVTLQSVATMAWSVIALSIGAVGLYLWLIRNGAVTRAAALIYLVPPTTAVEAWLMFNERLAFTQVLGVVIVVFGVALTLRRA